ncbi:hypothetical protein TKK_0001667 [Trichogramma kaykai]
MGTRSPSEFLEHLISSAGSILGRDTILRIWRETISANICVHLDDIINQENESNNVKKADRIYASFRRDVDSRASYGVDGIVENPTRRDDDARILNLEQKLDQVFDSLASYRNRRNQDKRNSGCSQSQRDSHSGGHKKLCYLHYKFGKDAHKCAEPGVCPWEQPGKNKNNSHKRDKGGPSGGSSKSTSSSSSKNPSTPS